MEFSTEIINGEYLSDLCYKQGDLWLWKPEVLDEYHHKPPVIINSAFWPFIARGYRECRAKHQQLMGGSGSGKSEFLATKFLLKAQQPGYFRLIYTRKHATEIRLSTFQLFKDVIAKYGWGYKFRVLESTMDIRCLTTNNMIWSAGLDDVDKLKSIADPTDIWIEEPISKSDAANVTIKDYTELMRRLRTPKAPTHLHSSYNPINKRSFYYTEFFKKKTFGTDVAIVRTTYRDNPFLPADYRQMLNDLYTINEDEAQIFSDGQWGEGLTEGRWIRTFKRVRHVGYVPFINGLPVHLTYDFNVKPYMTLLAGQLLVKPNQLWRDGTTKDVLQVRIFHEYCLSNPHNSAEAVTKAFVNDYPLQFGAMPVSYYGDASGKNGIPGIGGDFNAYVPIKNVLAPYLHNTSNKTLPKNPFLIDARELVEDVLGGKYAIEVLIDESNCPNLITDFEDLREAVAGFDKQKDKNQVEQLGHTYSSFSYLICSMFNNLLKQRGTPQQ